MKYKNTNIVTETQLNLDWYNRLLDIDDLSQHDDEHLALIEDECYGLYEFEFEDGSRITVDLCHGDANYYDDCVWTNKENTKTITFGCSYCLDSEMEFTVGYNTYICQLTIEENATQTITTPYGAFTNLEVTPYNEETYVLANLSKEEGYAMLGFDAPVTDDNVWRFWVELGYMDGSAETHSVELSKEDQDAIKELHFLYKQSLIPRTMVAIADLRDNDAWNYDWILVKAPVETAESTHDVAYKDACGDYILFDGTEEEAYRFYSKFCEKNNMLLIGYDTMVENFEESEDEVNAEAGEYEVSVKGLVSYSGYAESEEDAIIYAIDCFKDDDEFCGTEVAENVTKEDCRIITFTPNE